MRRRARQMFSPLQAVEYALYFCTVNAQQKQDQLLQ